MSGRLTARQHILRGLGVVFVGLGFLGAFLPLLPTTPFLLLALACFARSSPVIHDWLINHRLLGPYIVDWERDRSIPLAAKITSIVMMSASLAWLVLGTSAPAIALWMTGAMLLCVALYIVTRPTTRRPAR
ncbi:MAG: YbaN family protein [Anderseniella sp.]